MSFSVSGPRNYNYYRLAAPADMDQDIGPRNYNYYRLAAPADMARTSVHRSTELQLLPPAGPSGHGPHKEMPL